MTAALPLLQPDWPAPPSVAAAMSTRLGGVSSAPFDALNLSRSVGDDPQAVAENRRRWLQALGVAVMQTHLVHGADVIEVRHADAGAALVKADALWTRETGLACVVTAADCLPVLLCRRDGAAVAAVHAGWRGLAAGVVENTVHALCAGTACRPADLMAWLGPCIGPRQFEVGADVLQAFGRDVQSPRPEHFVPRARSDGSPRWLADLAALARERLGACGVQQISSSGLCTVEEASRFFSFRRDRITGRMAAAIWRRG